MMVLPPSVLACIRRLEEAGFEAYAVGGCVRDALLGRRPQDYDLCTGATPQEMREIFSDFRLVLAGEKHGTVTVIAEGVPVEITAFRAEGDYRDHRRPGWVRFVRSLEADLARRDFTVNAMAWSPKRGLQDPFGGREDLKQGILRCVGDPDRRFEEDALRILRCVRFAVRYGFAVEEATRAAMARNVALLEGLARERVFSELCGILPKLKARDLESYAFVFTQVLPELAPTVGFQQKNPHHIYDVYTHTAHVVEAVGEDLALRWAALLHDVGKPETFTLDGQGVGHFLGHAQVSANMAEAALLRLKAPRALREQAVTLIAQHMAYLEPDQKLLSRRRSRLGQDTLQKLITLQEADTGGKGTDPHRDYFAAIRAMMAQAPSLTVKDLAVTGHDLMALGLTGKAIGQAQRKLLRLVLEEGLPNDKNTLMEELL